MLTKIRLLNFGFYSTLFLALSLMISSQAYSQTAIGQCAGIGDEGNFKIFIDRDTSTRDFRIYVVGC